MCHPQLFAVQIQDRNGKVEYKAAEGGECKDWEAACPGTCKSYRCDGGEMAFDCESCRKPLMK